MTEPGPAGPLYLGKLPTRVADEYSAILSYRPPQNQQVGAALPSLIATSQRASSLFYGLFTSRLRGGGAGISH